MFWFEENLILSNVLITRESNFDEKNVEEMFNWSEVHSEKKYYFSDFANFVVRFFNRKISRCFWLKMIRDHPLKTSADFHDLWPLPPSVGKFGKFLTPPSPLKIPTS